MTRGALVLFVGLFSVIFLKRHLYLFHWAALFIVMMGVAIVGLAGAVFKQPDINGSRIDAQDVDHTVLQSIVGVLLIAGAQIFTATQFVLEEYILENYAMEPLQVVGWEGIFGFTTTVVGMVILHFSIGVTEAGRNGYFDASEGLRQVGVKSVWESSVLIMISIGYVQNTIGVEFPLLIPSSATFSASKTLT